MYYIYKLTFLKTNKFYIGQTCDLDKRKKRHLDELRTNKHHSVYFQRAYNKYGGADSDFLFEVLFESENKKEIDKEAKQNMPDLNLICKCLNTHKSIRKIESSEINNFR